MQFQQFFDHFQFEINIFFIDYRKKRLEMKAFKKTKPKNPTILQQESNKLKQKLQLLKQQVIQKRQQKQMNKTATSLQQQNQSQNNRTLNFNTKNNTQLSFTQNNNDSKLQNILIQMKIQTIEQKLKQKGIKNYQNFIQLTEEQIDQWKDIVLGYRLKIKKYIKNIKSSISNTENMNKNPSSEIKQSNLFRKYQKIEQNQKNIQDIIKQRQLTKIFIPLKREYEEINEQQYENHQQITEQDQDIMIQSFMNVFQPRKSILKPTLKQMGKNKDKKIVWSKQVDKMEKVFQAKSHKKYPKQSIAKDALINYSAQHLGSQQSIPDPENNFSQSQKMIKYCWKCFRKINIHQNIVFRVSKDDNLKYFCCEKCENLYESQIWSFSEKITNKNVNQKKKQEKKQILDEEQDLEVIDLQIL